MKVKSFAYLRDVITCSHGTVDVTPRFLTLRDGLITVLVLPTCMLIEMSEKCERFCCYCLANVRKLSELESKFKIMLSNILRQKYLLMFEIEILNCKS